MSLLSRDQAINDGGRALKAAVRPYARKIAGEPAGMLFDIRTAEFTYIFRHANGVDAPTEIFIPEIQYPQEFSVEVSDGTFELDDTDQTLSYKHSISQKDNTIRVRPK